MKVLTLDLNRGSSVFVVFCLFIEECLCHGSRVDYNEGMPFVGTLPQIFLSSEYLHYFVSIAEKVCLVPRRFSVFGHLVIGGKCCICLPILPL